MNNLNRNIPPPVLPQDNIDIQRPMLLTMRNKVPLYIINAGSQDVVRMDILFKGGNWYQTHKLQALFTNRMLREGTKRYTAKEIAEKLDYYGAWLELSSSLEYAYISLYSLNKYFSQTLDIIHSIIREPVFPEKELSTVIETNLQQFRINSSKVDFIAHRKLLTSVFGEEYPCGRLAAEEDYKAINTEWLREFHEHYYHSGNCSIYLSGKVTSDIIKQVEAAWGEHDFGKTNLTVPVLEFPIHTISEKRIYIERQDAQQTSLRLGQLAIPRQHPDHLKLRVLITLFGGYFGSRLMSNIREDKGYTYGISAGLFFYPGTGLMVISTEAGNDFVENVIQEVYHEIDRLQNEKVNETELLLVKNYMKGEMARNYESPFSLADAWSFIHTSGLSDDYFGKAFLSIDETTPDDLLYLAGKYMNKENLKEIIVGINIS